MNKSAIGNYGGALAMLAGVAAGALVGCFWKEAAAFVKPVGDIFLNLLFVLVVPLVFFSVTLSFCRLKAGGNVGRVLLRTLASFAILWLLGSLVAYAGVLAVNPLGTGFDYTAGADSSARAGGSGADALVGALSVPDFPMLFSKYNLLPLIVFSALCGLGTAAAGRKGEGFAAVLESGNEVVIKTMGILMKAAPIGLGCYFADTIARFGASLMGGYLRVFLLYCATAAIVFFVINPLIILRVRGKAGLKAFWREILPPTVTALATASSSAAMPGNIAAAKGMGLQDEVADTVIPLGTNLLKTGSVMCGVFKVAFLLLLGGSVLSGAGSAAVCIGTAILAAIVSGAVTNGGVTGEILTCSLLGMDPAMIGIIMIIGTLCDVPATALNSQSTVVATAMVDGRRHQDGL